jgi:hypothetical protein
MIHPNQKFITKTKSKQINDDKQILSTKLSIDDYNAFLILTKIKYEPGLIKGECTWGLLRFTICHILNQVHKQPEYLILKQQQQEQVQNNQQ